MEFAQLYRVAIALLRGHELRAPTKISSAAIVSARVDGGPCIVTIADEILVQGDAFDVTRSFFDLCGQPAVDAAVRALAVDGDADALLWWAQDALTDELQEAVNMALARDRDAAEP